MTNEEYDDRQAEMESAIERARGRLIMAEGSRQSEHEIARRQSELDEAQGAYDRWMEDPR